jgi:hypothetical protein
MPLSPALRAAWWRRACVALGPALVAGLTACVENRSEQSTTNVTTIRADTTVVGQITFQLGNGFDPSAPGGADIVTYKNTTTRTFARLAIALGPNLTSGTGTCVPLRPALTDTILVNVIPNQQVELLRGLLPGQLRVFVAEAREGTTNLVNTFAGRWAGSFTEWRGSTVTSKPAVGVSQSGGRLSVLAAVPGDTMVFESQLASPRPLSYSAYPNTCDGSYLADPQAVAWAFGGDTLRVSGRAVSSAATVTTLPDSFRLRLQRR